jgi:hypothetical protein
MTAFRTTLRVATAAAVLVLGTSLAGCSIIDMVTGNVTRDESGAATGDNSAADVFDIEVGDCLNDAAAAEEVSTLPLVTCDQPHDTEVVASVTMDDGDYPGEDAIVEFADGECIAAFEDYVGFDYETSLYDYNYYLPTADGWAGGDHEILCTVYDPAGKIDGTLAGAAQ